MFLAVDIGNSSTKLGVFDGKEIVSRLSIPTRRTAGASYVGDEVAGRLTRAIDSALIASVVPEMEKPIREYLQLEHNVDPVFVDHDSDFGLKVNYVPVTSVGIDRIVNASAAASLYGKPCIVCSFGTATTIDVVSADREFLGGIIAPGMQTMAKALHLSASKLPEVEIEKPENTLGNSTVGSIQSGIYYGYIGLVEGLIRRMAEELTPQGKALICAATGGFAEMVGTEVPAITVVNSNLTLEGLQLLSEKRIP